MIYFSSGANSTGGNDKEQLDLGRRKRLSRSNIFVPEKRISAFVEPFRKTRSLH